MALLKGNKLRSTGVLGEVGTFGYVFWCPGCESSHHVTVKESKGRTVVWGFNGDVEKPTFSPSLLVRYHRWEPPVTPKNFEEYKRNPWQQTKVDYVCHSFIREGKIEFLTDCTHKLAGKTVEIPDFPKD